MGKTIKQIADELGVSKTAVRKKMTSEIANQFSETIGNTVFVSKQGENIIKSAFVKPNANQVCGNQSETDSDLVSTLVSTLQHELEVKNQQISEQSKIIENLSDALISAQRTAAQAQALHAGTIQQQITDGHSEDQTEELHTEKKKKWWQFNKK